MRHLLSLFILITVGLSAQNNSSYWQQHVSYKMQVNMDVKNYKYTGSQELVYTNNSPDTLKKVFYHLYFNAFQPGSEMDVNSRTIADPDGRVLDRISKLQPEEYGFLKVMNLQQNGKDLTSDVAGTILEVTLATPIAPGAKSTFTLNFQGQVPLQIRRSGRNNKEGVALSMTQWYPKMAEYDFEGWHADPYIGREFHGVWGDFDVTITIDKKYILGGSGYLQNGDAIGYGYETPGTKIKRKGKTLSWHFIAPNVHDFTWAADPDYIHDTLAVPDGPMLHFLYKNNPKIIENWKKLQPKTAQFMTFFNQKIGAYPYKQYSVIQGGDGGMEYAMCTLITGERSFGSLAGVTAHELAHSWFQHILATNESKHEWMDEGFTSYISANAMAEIMDRNKENPHTGAYQSYMRLVQSGKEQPQTTHSDRYAFNSAYGASAYSKGQVFLAQLGYIIGEQQLAEVLKKYYDTWKFKHPTPNDFKRIAENISGMQLDWYLTDWTQTTNQIEYGIKSVVEKNGTTQIELHRNGLMPMPIELFVLYEDGTKELIYIPLQMMRGTKPVEYKINRSIAKDWAWAIPNYTLTIEKPLKAIKNIIIDPSSRMADVNPINNIYPEPTKE